MTENAQSLSVLIVEDLEDAANSTAELLALFGHVVRIAACGVDALREAAAETPDVVLLDIGLPEMSGWELARHLRIGASGKQPFIVAVTGYGTDNDRENSAQAGIDMHLVKPVNPAALTELLKWVRECLAPDVHPPVRGLVRVCAWCGKVFANGGWRSAKPAPSCTLTRGMCPACFDASSDTPG